MDHSTSHLCHSHISWSAIVAGTITAIVIGSSFNFLGIALGLTSFNANLDTLSTLGNSSIVWVIVSSIIYALAGGWVAAHYAGEHHSYGTGILHGFIAWSLATIFTFMVVTSAAGSALSGTAQLLGSTLSAAGKGVATTLNSSDTNQIGQTINQVLQQSSGSNIQLHELSTDPQLIRAVNNLMQSSDDKRNDARELVINLLTAHTDMSRADAEKTVANWEQKYQDLQQQAQQMTEKTANTLGNAALILFFSLVISAIAGGLGGMLGARKMSPE